MRRAHASASSSSTTGITLRIRHKGGMWRVKGVNPQSMTAGQLKERINKEYKVPVEDQTLRKEYQGEPLPDQKSLKQAGIAQNGEIVFCDFEEEAPVLETDPKAARTIGKDGNITRASVSAFEFRQSYVCYVFLFLSIRMYSFALDSIMN